MAVAWVCWSPWQAPQVSGVDRVQSGVGIGGAGSEAPWQ